MKTKFSFLAMALYLGLALAFVLSACGGGDDTPPPSTSSPSSAPYNPSSEVNNDSTVKISNFGLTELGGKYYIAGLIQGSQAKPIVRLEFTTEGSGWVSFGGTPTNAINLPVPSRVVDLSNDGPTIIDLSNTAIDCNKQYSVTVKACIDATCSAGNFSTKNGTFTKTDPTYCASSSSGGGVSSSSELAWVFGGLTTASVPQNTDVPIGASFVKLSGDDTQPLLTVTGGAVRDLVGCKTILAGADDPVVGKAYSAIELGNTSPTGSTYNDLNENCYYLIYIGGDTRYLIRFKRSGDKWYNWPKQVQYWQAQCPCP